jgi:hypothetical protein
MRLPRPETMIFFHHNHHTHPKNFHLNKKNPQKFCSFKNYPPPLQKITDSPMKFNTTNLDIVLEIPEREREF